MSRPLRPVSRHPRPRVISNSPSELGAIDCGRNVSRNEFTEERSAGVNGKEGGRESKNNGRVRTKSKKRRRSSSPLHSWSDPTMDKTDEPSRRGREVGQGGSPYAPDREPKTRAPTPYAMRLDIHHRHPFDGMDADEYFDEDIWSEETDQEWVSQIPDIFSHPRPIKYCPRSRTRHCRSILTRRCDRKPTPDPAQPRHRLITFSTVVTVIYRVYHLIHAHRRARRYGRVGLYDESKRRRTS